jgi:FkbM family methyltransferase
MLRTFIRNVLNRNGYEIIRQEYIGDLYPNLSKENDYYCETPNGNYFFPQPVEKDPVSNMIARGNIFESEIIELSKKYITPNSSVLDIGANFGQMSIQYSKYLNEIKNSKMNGGGKVYSFEAQNLVYNYLERNIIANHCDNVKTYKNAVFNKSDIEFYFEEISLENSLMYSTNNLSTKVNIHQAPVLSVKIDDMVFEEKISFIKVDIQGSDLAALQGAENTILKHKPAILFEYEEQFQEKFKSSFNDYVDFVRKINYKYVKTINNINYLIVPND